MKKILSISLLVAVAAVLALSVPAFSRTMDMTRGEHRGHEHMMDMGNMDMWADMTGMCMEHADKLGLTDEQIMKIQPIHVRIL